MSSPETFTKPLISSLDDSIKAWLEEQPTDDPVELISILATHIRSKIYSTEYQGTYQQKARDSDDYITNLWYAPKLECYSANHLMVALSRYCNIPARLAM